MARLSLSHLSSLLRPSSLSTFRLPISPFFASADRSPVSTILHPASYRSDLRGSAQLDKEVSGCIGILQGDSGNAGRAQKALGVLGPGWSLSHVRGNASIPYSLSSKCYVHFDSRTNIDPGRDLRSMNFVRGILEEDRKDFMVSPQVTRHNMEKNADIVHVKLMRNNTFITVTDNKGNTKLKASAGRLEELKGGPKLSRYAAEAIAEYVGRESRKLGIKSVVMRVKGFTFFKKKKQAILSWRDGFTDSKSDQNPIVYIEDTTRRAHNGCRLPKRRRV